MSAATSTRDHGTIVSMPETFPETESEFLDALGPVSEVLQDAQESILNVLWAARDKKRFTPSQAGELLLRARFYKEVSQDILEMAERLERVAYDGSLYGPPE